MFGSKLRAESLTKVDWLNQYNSLSLLSSFKLKPPCFDIALNVLKMVAIRGLEEFSLYNRHFTNVKA